MSGSQHTEVVLELDAEITAEYLPMDVQPLAKLLQVVFVGHEIGGRRRSQDISSPAGRLKTRIIFAPAKLSG